MRLDEILAAGGDIRENRLEELRMRIEAGERPFIAAATHVRDGFAWGDLEKLGWATRHRRVISSRDAIVEEWWEYTGPGAIMVEPYRGYPPVEAQAGYTTDRIEVDYS